MPAPEGEIAKGRIGSRAKRTRQAVDRGGHTPVPRPTGKVPCRWRARWRRRQGRCPLAGPGHDGQFVQSGGQAGGMHPAVRTALPHGPVLERDPPLRGASDGQVQHAGPGDGDVDHRFGLRRRQRIGDCRAAVRPDTDGTQHRPERRVRDLVRPAQRVAKAGGDAVARCKRPQRRGGFGHLAGAVRMKSATVSPPICACSVWGIRNCRRPVRLRRVEHTHCQLRPGRSKVVASPRLTTIRASSEGVCLRSCLGGTSNQQPKGRQPWIVPVWQRPIRSQPFHVGQTVCFAQGAMQVVGLAQDRVRLAQRHEAADEPVEWATSPRPVDPADRVVLAIGVVVAAWLLPISSPASSIGTPCDSINVAIRLRRRRSRRSRMAGSSVGPS